MNEDNINNDGQSKKHRSFYGGMYGGVWLILIGVIFLLNNFGFLQGEAWGKLWPLFIIIPGVFMIFQRRC